MDGQLEGCYPSLPSLDWSRCATASVHTWCPAPPRTGRTAHNQISRTWPRVPPLAVCATCLTCPASAAMTSLLGVGWAGLGWAGALNLIICRNLEKAGPWLGPDQTVAASTSRAWARSDLISCGASHLVPVVPTWSPHQYLAITTVSTLTVTHDNKPVRRCSYYLPK